MNRKLMVNYRKDGRNTRPRSQTLRITLAAGVALLLALAFGWFHFRSPFRDEFDDLICIIAVVLATPIATNTRRLNRTIAVLFE